MDKSYHFRLRPSYWQGVRIFGYSVLQRLKAIHHLRLTARMPSRNNEAFRFRESLFYSLRRCLYIDMFGRV